MCGRAVTNCKLRYYIGTMLFGIAGPTASGKTTVTDAVIENYQAEYIRYSMLLSEIAVERDLDPTDKATLQGLYVTLRKERGEGWLANAIADRIGEEKCEHLIIEGNRRKVDLDTLKDVADRRKEKLVFIFIDASLDTRFKRYNNRLETENKESITFEEFERLERNPAEDVIDDLPQNAKQSGIYIETDGDNIEEVKTLLKEALK